jgi:FkbM family methyltransferase
MKYTRQYVESKGRLYRQDPPIQAGHWLEVKALGIPLYVRKDDFSVAPCLINDGFWESWITAWLLNNIEPGSMFIDIGANTGYYSLIAAQAGMKVMAYEPNPEYVDMLRASIKLDWSQTRGDWTPESHFNVYEYAVSNKVGTATLTIPEHLQGSASIRDVDLSAFNPRTIDCMTVSLDYHLAGIPPTPMIIKVDAEGAEELVWEGAFTTRYRHKPVWMIEFTPGAYSEDFLDNLEKYGDLAWINHDGVEEPISQGEILTYHDWRMLVIRPRG